MNKKYDLAYECYARLDMMDVCQKIRAIQKQESAEEKLDLFEVRYQIDPLFY